MERVITGLFRSFRDSVAYRNQNELWGRFLSLKLLKYFIWLGALTVTLLTLWGAWPNAITGLPANFQAEGLDFFFLVLFYSYLFGIFLTSLGISSLARLRALAQVYPAAFRNALAARDAVIAPPVDDEQYEAPPTATTSEQAPATETFAPLAHPIQSMEKAGFLYFLGVLLGIAIIALGAWYAATTIPNITTSANSYPRFDSYPYLLDPMLIALPALIALGGVALVGWMLSGWRLARIERRGLVVVADADGVTMRVAGSSGNERRLRWADTRGFARLRYIDGMACKHTLYLLTTDSDDLVWDEPSVSRYLSPGEAASVGEMRDAAQRLARLATQRTGLPLRDLSAIMRAVRIGVESIAQPSATLFDHALSLARAQGDVALATHLWLGTHPGASEVPKYAVSRSRPRISLSMTPAQREDIVHYALALLPYYPTPEQMQYSARQRQREQLKRRWQKWDGRVQYSLALLALLGSGISYGLSHWYTPPQLRALPAQVLAQAPSYRTHFNAASYSDWPTRTPTSGDTRSASFTSSGYELSTRNPNQAEGVWSDSVPTGDHAYELTLTLTNAGSNSAIAAGGLLLDVSPDGSRALAFMVDQYGEALLNRCHDLNTPQGACDEYMLNASRPESMLTVNTDNGAANTLLVIRRGQMYLFYVNDAPAIVYRDLSGADSGNGSVGVYLDTGLETGAATADFTSISVYPIPASTPFWVR